VCRVHRTYMGHIERGEKNLSFSSIVRVAAALNVSLSELFEGLETGGTAQANRRHRRVPPLDRDRLLKELALLERVVRAIKELADSPTDKKMRSTSRKRSGQ
jgi:transcriptional regulator with XRE-family HTH domain